MNDVRPLVYAGHDAVIVRIPVQRRLVSAVISREALETRFQAGHDPQDWVNTYHAHTDEILAVVHRQCYGVANITIGATVSCVTKASGGTR